MWERNLGQNFWGPCPWGLISESFHEWYEKGQSTGDWCINKSYGIRASSIIIMALACSEATPQCNSSDVWHHQTYFIHTKHVLQGHTPAIYLHTQWVERWRWTQTILLLPEMKGIYEINFFIAFFFPQGSSKIPWVHFLFMFFLKYMLCLLS